MKIIHVTILSTVVLLNLQSVNCTNSKSFRFCQLTTNPNKYLVIPLFYKCFSEIRAVEAQLSCLFQDSCNIRFRTPLRRLVVVVRVIVTVGKCNFQSLN